MVRVKMMIIPNAAGRLAACELSNLIYNICQIRAKRNHCRYERDSRVPVRGLRAGFPHLDPRARYSDSRLSLLAYPSRAHPSSRCSLISLLAYCTCFSLLALARVLPSPLEGTGRDLVGKMFSVALWRVPSPRSASPSSSLPHPPSSVAVSSPPPSSLPLRISHRLFPIRLAHALDTPCPPCPQNTPCPPRTRSQRKQTRRTHLLSARADDESSCARASLG